MVITWKQLRDAREYADMTQFELAQRLNVSPRTIVNWERQGASVPRKSEYKVTRELGAAMKELEHHSQSSLSSDQLDPTFPAEGRYYAPDEHGQMQVVPFEIYEKYEQVLDEEADRRNYEGRQLARRRAALAPFTDMDLINELHDRTTDRGIAASDWSASGPHMRAQRNEYALGLIRSIDRDDFEESTDEEVNEALQFPHAASDRPGVEEEQEADDTP